MMIHVEFQNDTDLDFVIFDYVINLMFWGLCTAVNHPIWDIHKLCAGTWILFAWLLGIFIILSLELKKRLCYYVL